MINKQVIKQFLKPNWKKMLIFGVICSIFIYFIFPWPWYKTQSTLADRDDQGQPILIKSDTYRLPSSPILTYSLVFITPAPLFIKYESSLLPWRQDPHMNNMPILFLTLLFVWYYFFACLIFFCVSKFSSIPKSKLISGIGLGIFATLISCLFIFLMYYILPFPAWKLAFILTTIPYIVTAYKIFYMHKRETAPSFIITTVLMYNFFLFIMYNIAFF